MVEETDYTLLPIGHVLSNGRMIAKCPSCGRNGVCMDLGKVVYVEHFALEKFTTAAGEIHGKWPRKNAVCHFLKANEQKAKAKRLG
jgi:hypothetical protein